MLGDYFLYNATGCYYKSERENSSDPVVSGILHKHSKYPWTRVSIRVGVHHRLRAITLAIVGKIHSFLRYIILPMQTVTEPLFFREKDGL